ncbi:hypothetical protein PUR71_26585 [Streptomyces sp. SP17BM10]|uniref:DUF6879 family protein n=1 Tax=Streptomyces sp. SP17BM10 TaxID=3002530 RepID=UPI002E787FFB|nr:DUF6879 family protein [Streptomyces sp. SP17BM10]MEE1786444.1 hypothetical protein [Streptomyces sp. SP17BM10]
MLKGEDFGRLFETFERTAFRLETLAVDDVDDEREEFAAFLSGNELPPEFNDNPWVRSMTDLGKQVTRVHVLRSPLSDYLRYELAAYPGTIKAGESIGIIDTTRQEVAGLPAHDFWLFDDARVYRMHYTDSGKFIGAEPLPDDRLAEYQQYRDIALAHAVPFGEYRAA